MNSLAIVKALMEIDESCSEPDSAYKIGEKYMFRTVTHIVTGKVVKVYPDGIVVSNAAWIPSTGRFAGAVETAIFEEVEPYPGDRVVIVNQNSMIDAVPIPNLPSVQK